MVLKEGYENNPGLIDLIKALVEEAGVEILDFTDLPNLFYPYIQISAHEAGLNFTNLKPVFESLKNSQVIELNLSGMSLRNRMKELLDSLDLTRIKKLVLKSCDLSHDDLTLLMKSVKDTQIAILDVSNNFSKLDINTIGDLICHLQGSCITHFALGTITDYYGGMTISAELSSPKLPFISIRHLGLCNVFDTSNDPIPFFSNLRHFEITHLYLEKNKFSPAELDALAHNLKDSKLEFLSLGSTNIGDAELDLLVEGLCSSEINELDLRECMITGFCHSALSLLCRESRIETLDLSSNPLKNSDLFSDPDFFEGSSISELHLVECCTNRKMIHDLIRASKNSKIKTLDFRDNFIHLRGMWNFEELFEFPFLSDVDFSNNILHQDPMMILENGLASSKLQFLDLTRCLSGCSNNFLANLIEGTKGTPIEMVDLSWNELSRQKVRAIASKLANTTFRRLVLKGNMIDHSVATLAAALKFSSITHLDLENNCIKDKGAKAIASCLRETQIMTLILRSNRISSRGAITIALAIKDSSLLTLDLYSNLIKRDRFEILYSQLQNTFITNFSCCSCGGGPGRYLFKNTLLRNRISTHLLVSTFKKIVVNSDRRNLCFEHESNNVADFVEHCLLLYKAILERPSAVCVLVEDKSIRLSRSEILTIMREEFPQQFSLFIATRIEADVMQHVSLLKRIEYLGLKSIVEFLLPHRPIYTIDESRGILHPYFYKLLHKYGHMIFNLAIEPFGRRRVIEYFLENVELDGAWEAISLFQGLFS